MIALILGTETDWYRNVRAAGGCMLLVGRISYALTRPEVVDQAACPWPWQGIRGWPRWSPILATEVPTGGQDGPRPRVTDLTR
jgi:hypothetical protein